jgi:hypothetical protein
MAQQGGPGVVAVDNLALGEQAQQVKEILEVAVQVVVGKIITDLAVEVAELAQLEEPHQAEQLVMAE